MPFFRHGQETERRRASDNHVRHRSPVQRSRQAYGGDGTASLVRGSESAIEEPRSQRGATSSNIQSLRALAINDRPSSQACDTDEDNEDDNEDDDNDDDDEHDNEDDDEDEEDDEKDDTRGGNDVGNDDDSNGNRSNSKPRSATQVSAALPSPLDAQFASWTVSNIRARMADDKRTKVSTNWQFPSPQPLVVYTTHGSDDPAENGARGFRRFGETKGDFEAKFPEYKKRKKEYFVRGLVFEGLLALPSRSVISHITPGQNGLDGQTRVRRFVVIRPEITNGRPGFLALPILTYQGQGVACRGVVKSNHTIIYTPRQQSGHDASPQPPQPRSGELPRRLVSGGAEPGLLTPSVQVTPRYRDRPGFSLDPMARLNYGEPQSFDYGVKVKSFGQIHASSMEAFEYQFRLVWLNRRIQYAGHHTSQSPGSPSGYLSPPSADESSVPRADGSLEPRAGPSRDAAQHGRSDSGVAGPVDFRSANTPQQVLIALQQLRAFAEHRNLPAPPNIEPARAQYLAANPSVRSIWFDNIKEHWRTIARERQAARATNDAEDDDSNSE